MQTQAQTQAQMQMQTQTQTQTRVPPSVSFRRTSSKICRKPSRRRLYCPMWTSCGSDRWGSSDGSGRSGLCEVSRGSRACRGSPNPLYYGHDNESKKSDCEDNEGDGTHGGTRTWSGSGTSSGTIFSADLAACYARAGATVTGYDTGANAAGVGAGVFYAQCNCGDCACGRDPGRDDRV